MRFSARRLLRLVLSLVIVAAVWLRVGREWHDRTALRQMWLAAGVILSVLLLMIVIMELTGAQQKWRKLRDEVPKKPLGLDT